MSEGVFISYRRSASHSLARLIFGELRTRGYDVFLDVTTIDSGAFDRIILNQIAARPHFVLILAPGSLERCAAPGDWLRREIEEALRLGRNIVPVYDEGFNMDAEKVHLPEPLRNEIPRLNAPPYSHYYFDAFMDTLANRFLKMPTENIILTPTPLAEKPEVQQRIAQVVAEEVRAKHASPLPPPDVAHILPPPFEWCYIPAGQVTLEAGGYVPEGGQTFDVPAFYMAKYPVTNRQYAKFIEAGGYQTQEWWTEIGWHWKENRTKPRHWQDKEWNSADYPVVGVSWYEAAAFCLWLSAATGESITLPTEQQWQRAAQGDDGRAYPWGNEWDASRCNNGIDGKGVGKTTPVRRYEGKGDSPYGVVDMSGNVWEWCLTDSAGRTDDMSSAAIRRVLRGGSWYNGSSDHFCCDFRFGCNPDDRNINGGFRVSRS